MKQILSHLDKIPDETVLEEVLSEPTEAAVGALAALPGDLMLLGIGGKMGPSLARLAQRATAAAGSARRIIGVSRFTNRAVEASLRQSGIETIRCDLLDEAAVQRLPDAPTIIYMTGMKFGSTGDPARLWAMNTLLPASLARRFPDSRWLAFSTGNVYAMTLPSSGGSVETDPLEPVGEYGMSCLGRERVLEYASRRRRTPMLILRLNYACDLRYGVLVDLARQVWAGRPIDVAMGFFNTIWQGDANDQALQALAHADSPPVLLNLTGPETLSVRQVAETLGQLMDKPVSFTGQESATALLSNAGQAAALFGPPRVPAAALIRWVAHWVVDGNPTLGKPTKFQIRDGRF